MQVILGVRHPNRPKAKHTRVIEDLLEIANAGRIEALNAIINMLENFHEHGRDSRFVSKFTGLPIWELKTASRGGPKGGSRVYFFFLESGEAVLVNAEVKPGDSPDPAKIKEVLHIYKAIEAGSISPEGRKS
jgi:hypothetical protein